jgi:hypothetical protein
MLFLILFFLSLTSACQTSWHEISAAVGDISKIVVNSALAVTYSFVEGEVDQVTMSITTNTGFFFSISLL